MPLIKSASHDLFFVWLKKPNYLSMWCVRHKLPTWLWMTGTRKCPCTHMDPDPIVPLDISLKVNLVLHQIMQIVLSSRTKIVIQSQMDYRILISAHKNACAGREYISKIHLLRKPSHDKSLVGCVMLDEMEHNGKPFRNAVFWHCKYITGFNTWR